MHYNILNAFQQTVLVDCSVAIVLHFIDFISKIHLRGDFVEEINTKALELPIFLDDIWYFLE